MKILSAFLLLILFLQTAPAISAPVSGQTLRGKVDIIGTTDIPNFSSAQLDFGYASGPVDNWFAIQILSQPAVNAVLATWDTTFISDGDYNLRLHILLQDGTSQDLIVTDLHIRNYTADTPTPIQETPTGIQQATLSIQTPLVVTTHASSTVTPHATPSPLPANPAAISTDEIYTSLQRGALMVLVLFIAFALLSRLRRS